MHGDTELLILGRLGWVSTRLPANPDPRSLGNLEDVCQRSVVSYLPEHGNATRMH